ncbi:MAG: TrmH family RNA methyltransferase [Candidatus Aminicenantia bacterium]
MPTKERIEKVKKVLSLRQPDLRVVLEEIKNTHNANAVLRTCEAAGVLNMDVISSDEQLPINEAISTGAEKWLKLHFYSSTTQCLTKIKALGLKIAVTYLNQDALPYYQIDYTQPIAIVFGNESEGVSQEALKFADWKIRIPMVGMVWSLNLSVSAGIILYEAFNQRLKKGFFNKKRLSKEEFAQLYQEWLYSK